MWNTKWDMLRITDWEKSCVFLSTFLGGFLIWKNETKSIQLCYREPQRKTCWRRTWSFLQQLKIFSEIKSSFWLHFEKQRRLRVQIFLLTRKQYPAGSVQTCVHQGQLGKAKGFLHKTDVIQSCSRERMNTKWRFFKLTILTVNCICCFTQRRTYGVQGGSLTRTTFEKTHNQLSHVWREHETTI